MAERIRVGIIYKNDENWIGGSYYIQNLVAALCTLPDSDKPVITVFSETKEEFEQIERTGYPYLQFRLLAYRSMKLSIRKRIVNKLSGKLRGYDVFPQMNSVDTADIDVIFPSPVGLQVQGAVKKTYWIPDFQESYYPDFFTKETISARKQNHRFISKTHDHVVFSSENAKKDFTKLFPLHHCRSSVLQFAVTHPLLDDLDINEIRSRYGIKMDYYISPNQLWEHKNQRLVIEAAALLKKQGKLDFEIIFTGKEQDNRNPEYVPALKAMVTENGLQEQVRFLGFIDRKDQLKLIEGAIAVIQPSLFEGWSTVIEDGKALNKFILASDLPVHREQLPQHAVFFDPHSPESLAKLLLEHRTPEKITWNYGDLVNRYAKDFLRLVNK
jgi:glycosyltransferase involved in cell wall biosynthesis